MLLRGDDERARRIAELAEGAVRERRLGWVDVADGQRRRAARHFARARELAPGDAEALIGLVASAKAELRRGPVPQIAEAELPPPVAALIQSWRLAANGDWSGIISRDAELASFAPGDALFGEAARLRARWRVESGDRAQAAEAVAIAQRALAHSWSADDALLHARAAAAAGDVTLARGSLELIAALGPPGERGRDLARSALAIAEALPADRTAELRARLTRRIGGLVPGAGAHPFTAH
jgi:hypothetical protein